MASALDKICRTCMCSSSVLLAIFENSQEAEDTIFEMLKSIDLHITPEEHLPTNICIVCLSELNKAYSFQKRAKRSERTFRSYLKKSLADLDTTLYNDVAAQSSCTVPNTIIAEDSQKVVIPTNDNILVQYGNEEIIVTEKNEPTLKSPVVKFGYSCDVCGVFFDEKQNLQEHLMGQSHLAKYCSHDNEVFLLCHTQKEHGQVIVEPSTEAVMEITEIHNTGYPSELCIPQQDSETDQQFLFDANSENPTVAKSGHTCKECGIEFIRKKNYHNHMYRYHVRTYEVQSDGKVDEILNDNRPEYTAVPESETVCIEEPPPQQSSDEIEEGKLIQIPNAQFNCTKCDAMFVVEKSLHIHMKNGKCTETKYTCEICKRVFVKKTNLDLHKEQQHLNKPFKCLQSNCVFSFDQSSDLMNHAATHTCNKKYCCHFCSRSFNMSSTLKDHIRTHTNEKPYLCPLCGKAFSQSTNMKQHLMRHGKIKMFKCNLCSSAFVSKGELSSHTRTHTGSHPFICSVCGSGFTTSSSLVKHNRIHTGERPYACSYCPMRFTALGTLKNHRRTHTGEKPYACSYCNRAFAQKSDLVSHSRTHSGVRPFQCSNCGLSFQHCSILKKHLKTHEKSTIIVSNETKITTNEKMLVDV